MRITSVLCSITSTLWPFAINAFRAFSSLAMSWKCKPVVGSSKMKSVGFTSCPFVRKEESLMRCASPPLSVLLLWPSFT